MNVLREIVRGAGETIRETLPSTTDEAGVFVAGMCWAVVLCLAGLLLATWMHCSQIAGRC